MIKVFIADDSSVIRERLNALLSDLPGVEVIGEAGDAEEALKGIQELNLDVVILDIRMPGGNGIRVLEKIKKSETSPVIIMLTNYPYPQYRKKCTDLGADYFFDKSTEFERIIEVFNKLAHDSNIFRSSSVPDSVKISPKKGQNK